MLRNDQASSWKQVMNLIQQTIGRNAERKQWDSIKKNGRKEILTDE